MLKLFESENHKNVFVDNLSSGQMVQATQHIIVDNGIGMLLDPGGYKVYAKLYALLCQR